MCRHLRPSTVLLIPNPSQSQFKYFRPRHLKGSGAVLNSPSWCGCRYALGRVLLVSCSRGAGSEKRPDPAENEAAIGAEIKLEPFDVKETFIMSFQTDFTVRFFPGKRGNGLAIISTSPTSLGEVPRGKVTLLEGRGWLSIQPALLKCSC